MYTYSINKKFVFLLFFNCVFYSCVFSHIKPDLELKNNNINLIINDEQNLILQKTKYDFEEFDTMQLTWNKIILANQNIYPLHFIELNNRTLEIGECTSIYNDDKLLIDFNITAISSAIEYLYGKVFYVKNINLNKIIAIGSFNNEGQTNCKLLPNTKYSIIMYNYDKYNEQEFSFYKNHSTFTNNSNNELKIFVSALGIVSIKFDNFRQKNYAGIIKISKKNKLIYPSNNKLNYYTMPIEKNNYTNDFLDTNYYFKTSFLFNNSFFNIAIESGDYIFTIINNSHICNIPITVEEGKFIEISCNLQHKQFNNYLYAFSYNFPETWKKNKNFAYFINQYNSSIIQLTKELGTMKNKIMYIKPTIDNKFFLQITYDYLLTKYDQYDSYSNFNEYIYGNINNFKHFIIKDYIKLFQKNNLYNKYLVLFNENNNDSFNLLEFTALKKTTTNTYIPIYLSNNVYLDIENEISENLLLTLDNEQKINLILKFPYEAYENNKYIVKLLINNKIYKMYTVDKSKLHNNIIDINETFSNDNDFMFSMQISNNKFLPEQIYNIEEYLPFAITQNFCVDSNKDNICNLQK